MTSLRSILLHLDPSPHSTRRLLLARELAARHGACVTALYASTASSLSLPFVLAQGAGELVSTLQQLDWDHRDNAKALFDRATAGATAPMQWCELRGEPVITGVARRSLCADLLVLGQHDPTDPLTLGVPPDFVASVLLAGGRPALVVPRIDTGAPVGQDILIAWKATRESARAVTAALPMLQRARRIHLALSDDQEDPDRDQALALEDYLHAHDVRAPLRRYAAVAPDQAGDALLSLAADVGADLLVMGCYGHSRARELVLGGASRTVLQSMTLPVLMAH